MTDALYGNCAYLYIMKFRFLILNEKPSIRLNNKKNYMKTVAFTLQEIPDL